MWTSYLIPILVLWNIQIIATKSIETNEGAKNFTFRANGKTYFSSFGDKVDASSALDACAAINGKLLSIETSYEISAISQRIAEELGDKSGDFWTSGYKTNDSQWKWLGTGNLLEFTNWARGYPNNTDASQDCIIIHKDVFSIEGYWRDVDCNMLYDYVCEF